jgi:hypothetical protein
MTSLSERNQGIPVFMIGRSAENGKEILPALAPEFDSTRGTTHACDVVFNACFLTYDFVPQ